MVLKNLIKDLILIEYFQFTGRYLSITVIILVCTMAQSGKNVKKKMTLPFTSFSGNVQLVVVFPRRKDFCRYPSSVLMKEIAP